MDVETVEKLVKLTDFVIDSYRWDDAEPEKDPYVLGMWCQAQAIHSFMIGIGLVKSFKDIEQSKVEVRKRQAKK